LIDYDPHHWRSHFFDIKGSMVREIAYRVGFCALVAIGVSIAYHYHAHISISERPHALVGPALALLLVFRTNSANDRYVEGRRLWGGIVNSSRNLRRKASELFPDDPATVDAIVEWTIAFAWSTRARLVDRKALGPSSKLSADDQALALAASHVPSATAAKLTELVAGARKRGAITDIQQQMLDADIQALIDHIGGCERILSTPLPFAYAVHLRRALILYCASLPFALVDNFHEWTVVVSVIVAYILIGIEEIGTEIEGPFGERHNDLPLDRICTNLEAQLRDPSNAP
jgi:ion channel-forming bestrophin family protein